MGMAWHELHKESKQGLKISRQVSGSGPEIVAKRAALLLPPSRNRTVQPAMYCLTATVLLALKLGN